MIHIGIYLFAGTPIQFALLEQAAFQTPLNHSYACLAQEVLKNADGTTVLKLSDIRLEAFRTAGFMEFSSCKFNWFVPICQAIVISYALLNAPKLSFTTMVRSGFNMKGSYEKFQLKRMCSGFNMDVCILSLETILLLMHLPLLP
jgi:hypothetical protein